LDGGSYDTIDDGTHTEFDTRSEKASTGVTSCDDWTRPKILQKTQELSLKTQEFVDDPPFNMFAWLMVTVPRACPADSCDDGGKPFVLAKTEPNNFRNTAVTEP
jgi:hypothetical protein